MTYLRFLPLISLVLSGEPQAPIFQAELTDGQVVRGSLQIFPADNHGKHGEFRPSSVKGTPETPPGPLSLRGVRILRNLSLFRPVQQVAPQFQFHLRGGERFTGEIVRYEPTQSARPNSQGRLELSLRVRGTTPRTLADVSLEGLFTPPRERLVHYQDFESDAQPWTINGRPVEPQQSEHLSGRKSVQLPGSGTPVTCRMPQFPARGRIQWHLSEKTTQPLVKLKPADGGGGGGWKLEFHLANSAGKSKTGAVPQGNSPASSWVVQTGGEQYTSTSPGELRLVTLPVARRPGWRQWTLRLSEDRTLLCVDGEVLVVGPALTRSIESFSIQVLAKPNQEAPSTIPSPPTGSVRESHSVWIDDFLVLSAAKSVSEMPQPRNTQPRELLWLISGDELFGTAANFSPTGFAWNQSARTQPFSWGDAAGLLMPRPPESPSNVMKTFTPTRGWQAWVELSDGEWSQMRQSDRLWLALQELDRDHLVAEHHVLGQLRIPLREVRLIEPQFFGERWLLETATVHLGDEVRDDFSVPIPHGSQIERRLAIERLPTGQPSCSFLVEDLEPAGPQTPESSPYAATVRAGHLQTALYVNDHLIGDLNRQTSQKARPGQPARLRIPMPAGTLRAGQNTFRLKQSSASDDPRNFDDCQVSQWAVEWEQGD